MSQEYGDSEGSALFPGCVLPAHLSLFLKDKQQMSELCDAILICEGRKFPVSKVVLAAASKYFNCLFTYTTSEHQEKEFTLEGLTSIGLAEVLNHLTGSKMVLTMSNVCDVLHAADFLIVPAASQMCSTFLAKNLKPYNVLGVESAARRFDLGKVEERCHEFAVEQLEEVAACEEFRNLSLDNLTRLLVDDRVGLKEVDVLRIAFTWLEADQPARRSHLKRVLDCVRFGLMDFKSFQECAANHGVKDVVKEANKYLTALQNLNQYNADQLRTLYKESPAFALPRTPLHFIITLGGFSSTPKSGIEVFDPLSDRWSSLPVNLPQGLAYSTAQCLGGQIFIMGGVTVAQNAHELAVAMFGQTRMLRNIYIFDVNQSSIVSGVPMKEQRAFATSAQVGSTIYVFGGKGSPLSQLRMNTCEKLDTLKSPMNWERIAPMGSGRGDAGAVVVDGKVMVVGGFSGRVFLSSVEVYNPSSNTWQRGPSLKAPRSGMGIAALDRVVYVAGGNRGTGRLRSVERLLPGAKRYDNLLTVSQIFCYS